MNKIKKNSKSIIALVIIVIIVVLLTTLKKKDSTKDTPLPETPIENTNQPKTNKSGVSKPKPATVVDNRTYSELILAYKGRTLQFGNSCQVHMSNQVYKVGSDVLLDNRNFVPVSIKIGSNVYNLNSYGYKVVSLDSVGQFMIDCNDHLNVATLNVQK